MKAEAELRVCHVIGGLKVGGAERHLADLLNATQCQYRALVSIGEPSEGSSFYSVLGADIDTFSVPIRRRCLPFDMFKLVSLFRKIKPDVIHTHMYYANLYGGIAAGIANVPLVVSTEHGENPWKNRLQRWLERNVISHRTAMRFCVSERIRELRRDLDRIPEDKLCLIVNGTRLPEHVKAHCPNTRPVIGAVGRFVPAKNFPALVLAAKELVDRGHQFTLYILGDGPELKSIRDMVSSLSLSEYVILPGAVSDTSIWYPKFDIYVISSSREGQPLALLEAMAHGLPVVTTDAGSCAETVGEAGLVLPRENCEGLSEAIEHLLVDVADRSRLGALARRRVEQNYSISSVAEAHLSAYVRLL